jgi:hypothetical protein
MNQVAFQKTLTRVLALGAAGVTIFLVTGNVTDPVNAPKLFALGGLAGAALALLLNLLAHRSYRITGLEFLGLAFISWSLIAVVVSSAPLSQGMYGVYGRNTGFLTYTFLILISIAASQLLGFTQIKFVLDGFLIALAANLAYGLWVILFGDFLGWQNNYDALLGTFGNPNFISSFLGMGFSLVMAMAVKSTLKSRIALLTALPLIAWQLREADSLQGIVVAALGTAVVVYFWIRAKTQRATWSIAYLLTVGSAAAIAIIGALGSGPFKHVLSQPTVALREQYWLAAVNTAKSNPIWGVGMDSFGDWYRRARGPQALITPGTETVTNVAHNVFLDIFAFGGYPLLLMYILITGLGAVSIVRSTKRSKNYDPILVGITVLWVGYQAQSLISINQIGLAVWGWLINGAAVSYEFASRRIEQEKNPKEMDSRTKKRQETFSPQLIASVGCVAGLLISVPPMSADMKWAKVERTRQLNLLEQAMSNGYLSPNNSYRLANVVLLLEDSKLPDYAIKYARQGISFNPNYFDAWKVLYYSTKASQREKKLAKLQMIRLDPLNSELRKLP